MTCPAVVFVVNEDSHAFIVTVGHGPVHDQVVAALLEMGARVVADHPDASRAKGGLVDRIQSASQGPR